jgi:hypothetical protein
MPALLNRPGRINQKLNFASGSPRTRSEGTVQGETMADIQKSALRASKRDWRAFWRMSGPLFCEPGSTLTNFQ